MTTLDHQIRERLETCNWYALRAVLHATLDTCNRVEVGMDGPNAVGHAFAEEFRTAIASALGITQEATDGN